MFICLCVCLSTVYTFVVHLVYKTIFCPCGFSVCTLHSRWDSSCWQQHPAYNKQHHMYTLHPGGQWQERGEWMEAGGKEGRREGMMVELKSQIYISVLLCVHSWYSLWDQRWCLLGLKHAPSTATCISCFLNSPSFSVEAIIYFSPLFIFFGFTPNLADTSQNLPFSSG